MTIIWNSLSDKSHTLISLRSFSEILSVFFVCYMCVSVLSRVQLFATPWTVAHQAPLSVEFSTQGYWSRLPFPPPGGLPDAGVKPTPLVSLALARRLFFTTVPSVRSPVSLILTLSVGFCAFDEQPPFPVLMEFCGEVEPYCLAWP